MNDNTDFSYVGTLISNVVDYFSGWYSLSW